MRLDGLKVVIDCANGAAYKVAPEVLWELGATVIKVGVSPDGYNINDDCGSTSTALAAETIRREGADVGICLDGDADRVMILDENGNVADGDQIDRYVVEAMRANGWNLGGEQSGHIVMTDYATTGDGLLAGLQFLAAMVETEQSASGLSHSFETVPQMLKNVRYGVGQDPLGAATVQKSIADAEEKLVGKGRLLIRKSGTEPLIRVMAECEDDGLLAQVVNGIVAEVEAAV